MGRYKLDLTGQKYGMLTVIKREKSTYWLCQCDCGRKKVIDGRALRNGRAKSCGCMRGKRPIFHGCPELPDGTEDCDNCPYPDCVRPSWLC